MLNINAVNAVGLLAAPGGPCPAGFFLSGADRMSTPEPAPKLRSALYIDGFNLYHALDDLREPWLKWLDLWALGEALINKRQEILHAAVWCTAEYYHDTEKRGRHRAYKAALEASGVTFVPGHFVDEDVHCRKCSGTHRKKTEKEGDVNVAIHLIGDAFQDKYDNFYLLSADSDQTATAAYFRTTFGHKRLVLVAPPGRTHSKHTLRYASGHKSIWKETVEACLLPEVVLKDGKAVVRRPLAYAPPGASAPSGGGTAQES